MQITIKDLAIKELIYDVIIAIRRHSYTYSIAQTLKSGRWLFLNEIISTLEVVMMFAKWAPVTGLFNQRYGVRLGLKETDGARGVLLASKLKKEAKNVYLEDLSIFNDLDTSASLYK